MEKLLKLEIFAQSLGKNANTVRTWIARKKIPSSVVLKIGRSIFINTEKFDKWIDSCGKGE